MGRSAETTCGPAEAQALYVDARDWPLSHENRHMFQRALDQLTSWKETNLAYGDDWSAAISWINFLHSTWLPYFATNDAKLHKRALHTLRVLCRGSEILPIPLLVTQDQLRLPRPPIHSPQTSDRAIAFGAHAVERKGIRTACTVAVKLYRVPDAARREVVWKFFKTAIKFDTLAHANVCPIVGYGKDMFGYTCGIATRRMPNGNVLGYLRRNPDAVRSALLCDVLSGLQYLHSRGIVHGDLKATNMLVKEDEHACLINFSNPAYLFSARGQSRATREGSSLAWSAPELFEDKPREPDTISDVYSFASLIWEVYEEREPLSDRDTAEVPLPTGRIVTTRPLTPTIRPGRMTSWVYDSLWELLQQAWARRPEDRPGLEEFAPVLGWLAQRAG